MGDKFGKLFSITTWGESHGGGVGVVIDGCPAGLALEVVDIQRELDRRRPGQSHLTSQRKEKDEVEILSGVFEGRTLGTALAMLVRNQDARSKDYEAFKDSFRPSHADFTYERKYGLRNWKGGGRASARETVGRVAAGAVAKKLLGECGVETLAWVKQVQHLQAQVDAETVMQEQIDKHGVRCPDDKLAAAMEAHILKVRRQGDSVGGVIEVVVRGCPAGLGEPVFDKLTADLAKGVMSLPAARGVEFGMGFDAVALTGSQHNDAFVKKATRIGTASNRSGGIQGGISNGESIVLRVAFKPTATVAKEQQTVNREGETVLLRGRGRHDACVLPRAVPMVEAMVNLVLVDHLLRQAAQGSLWRRSS